MVASYGFMISKFILDQLHMLHEWLHEWLATLYEEVPLLAQHMDTFNKLNEIISELADIVFTALSGTCPSVHIIGMYSIVILTFLLSTII